MNGSTDSDYFLTKQIERERKPEWKRKKNHEETKRRQNSCVGSQTKTKREREKKIVRFDEKLYKVEESISWEYF